MLSLFEMKSRRRAQTPPEEVANSICHGLAFVAVLAACPALLAKAMRGSQPHAVAGVSIFAVTLSLLFLFSTIYHALPRNDRKRFFQKLDQTAIFLSIAGCYTPFAIGWLRTTWDWIIFYTIWGLTLGGIVFRAFQGFRGTHFTTFLYGTISLLALFALGPALKHLPAQGLFLLLGGLGLYAFGVLFFLAHHLLYRHLVWHVCSAVGSASMFLAVYWYAC